VAEIKMCIRHFSACVRTEKKPRVSPLRFALSKNISKTGPRNCRSLGFARDDKGEGDGSIQSGCWTEAFFITFGGPQAHDSSGRDDKFVEPFIVAPPLEGNPSPYNKFVISTGAKRSGEICGFFSVPTHPVSSMLRECEGNVHTA
jgi:hypothetical protein